MGILVLKSLVGLHRTIQLQLLQNYWLGHRLDYFDIEWFALETNRDHSALLGCNLKNNTMIAARFQGKPFNITGIQDSALTNNAHKAEVQPPSKINTPQKMSFSL